MKAGDPRYEGTPGNDVVVGSSSGDLSVLDEIGGTDLVCGGAGNDQVLNEGWFVALIGGSGNDDINGFGDGAIDAGAGNDTVLSRGGNAAIDCGSGRDRVNHERTGDVLHCETKLDVR